MDTADLIAQGYRSISRRHKTVARTDRRDWAYHVYQIDVEERVAYAIIDMAEQYCRCTSTDKIEDVPEQHKIPSHRGCWARAAVTDPYVAGLIDAVTRAMRAYSEGTDA